jgi:hypothetical protein
MILWQVLGYMRQLCNLYDLAPCSIQIRIKPRSKSKVERERQSVRGTSQTEQHGLNQLQTVASNNKII